ncbi:MAG: response regulator [Oscillospiraceae bacterium]|nr:response regulator [Oscillospiraceae bacterium]
MKNTRKKIFIVDDVPANLSIGRNLLKEFYDVYPAPSAAKLFEILEKVIPDLVLLDIDMPEMDGYQAIKIMKADTRFRDIPVIFLTAKDDEASEMEGFDLGALDYITKPFSGPLLLRRISNLLLIEQQKHDLKDYADNLEVKVKEKTDEIYNLQNAILATVTDLVEFRDKSTGGHIIRTQRYLKVLVDELFNWEEYKEEIEKWNMDFFVTSAQLHDVGKIAITDLILNKPGKLDPEEFEIMKTHTTVGVEATERIMNETKEHSFLLHALLIAGTHHEKWDGSGYPGGLSGKNIPLEGRLMAIVDVYDALVSERPYKKAFDHEKACGIIEENAGSHFDPTLVEVFKKVKDMFEKIKNDF